MGAGHQLMSLSREEYDQIHGELARKQPFLTNFELAAYAQATSAYAHAIEQAATYDPLRHLPEDIDPIGRLTIDWLALNREFSE